MRILAMLLMVSILTGVCRAGELELLQGRWVSSSVTSRLDYAHAGREESIESIELSFLQNTFSICKRGEQGKAFRFHVSQNPSDNSGDAFSTVHLEYYDLDLKNPRAFHCLIGNDGTSLTVILEKGHDLLPPGTLSKDVGPTVSISFVRPHGPNAPVSRHSPRSITGTWEYVATTVHGKELEFIPKSDGRPTVQFQDGQMTFRSGDVVVAMPYDVQGGFEWGAINFAKQGNWPARMTRGGDELELDVSQVSSIDKKTGHPDLDFSYPKEESSEIHILLHRTND